MSDIAVSIEKPFERRPGTLDGNWCRYQPLLLSAYILAALATIFYLPYLFPTKLSWCLSYAFGYNNRVGILVILMFSGIGALWLRSSAAFQVVGRDDFSIPRKTLASGLLGTALLCAAAYPLVSSATPVADAGYLINRIQLLAAGQRPYVDFEFAYGPALLYLPLWIAHALHIGIAQAYYWFWVLSELTGVFLLFRVIDEIDISSPEKPAIFLLFCAASGASFVLGAVSYTFTRFALSLWLAFRVYRADLNARNQTQRARTTFLSVVLFFSVLLLTSPEIALAFGIGSLGLLFLSGDRRNPAWWIWYAAMLAALTASTCVAAHVHLLDTFRTFGAGARDFPIIPAGHILLFLLCVFISFLHLARKVFRGEYSRSVYLILISVPMLASALGSCDPLHVLFNGFGFLLVGLLYLSHAKLRWDATRLVFFLFFVLTLFGGLVLEHMDQYRAKLETLVRKGEATPHILQASAYPGTHGVLEAPFGFSTPRIQEYRAPWIDTGRYLGMTNASSIYDVSIKELELERHPDRDVLVPAAYERLCNFNARSSRLWLELEYGAPYWMPLRHSENSYSTLCDFLAAHYHKVLPATSQSYNYEVWARNR